MPQGNLYTPGFLDSRDLIADFGPALEAANESLWSNSISIEIPTDRDTEELGWLGQVPVMRRWLGERQEENLNKYTLTARNYPYEVTLPISVDDLRRDKTGQIRRKVSELAVRTATHKNSLVGSWVTASEAGSLGLSYDGQFHVDTDHNESGTNQTNDLTATEVPSANVATTSTLTTTEAAGIVTETLAYMMSLTDDKGEPINQGSTEALILCTKVGHYNGLKTALGLANLGTGSGNNNPVLAWNDFRIRVEYVPQRITAADKLYFFFGNPSMSTGAMIWLDEYGVQTDLQGVGSPDEFYRNRHVFGVKSNRGVAYGLWQKTALVTLS